MPTIAANDLESFLSELLSQSGVASGESSAIAKSLVGANLRGHDSHGAMRVPYYLDALAKEEIKAGAEFTVMRETESLLAADGNWGFGQIQARELTERVIAKARNNGVCVGTLIQSSHIGRLGEYCELAAEAGMVSMMMVNTHGFARRVAPPGGTAPRLGTNPIAFGVPSEQGPIIVDFGTSITAEGKVRVKKIAGQDCPPGWLLDSNGQPTTDPNSLYANPPGTILPLGGDQSHKGFALGLIVEIFAGALSGGVCIREKPINQNGNCVFLQVFDPAAFGGAQRFTNEIGNLLDFIRGCPRAARVDQILLPGDPERNVIQQRLQNGIPFDEGNWKQLADLAVKLGVTVPAT